MIGAVSLTRFRELLRQHLGWTFTDHDPAQTGQVLAARARAHGLTDREYLDRLAGPRWTAEVAELAGALSITETYFFRHAEQFRVLREQVLPELIRARTGLRMLRMLSVGCSSGEEAYSLAITALQARPGPEWIVAVTGLDANPAMLRRARAAVYSSWSLRETPEQERLRWFRPAGEGFRLIGEVTGVVRFDEYNVADHNLTGHKPADDDPGRWPPGRYDVIFCRNLLMYLAADVVSGLIRRMTEALADDGFLFLGHTDSLGSRPDGLDVCHADGTVYYRRRAVPPAPAPASPPAPAPASSLSPPPASSAPASSAPGSSAPGSSAPASRPALDPADRPRLIGLIRAERFAEALAAVGDTDSLLRGVLLAQVGRVDEGRDTANRLLHAAGPQPDAHHLLGVCDELDCTDRAFGQYRLAAYLDPGFAMPRMRMGLLARRHGDDRGAAGHLAAALDLLTGEDEERIVLFGGGFGRLALTTLCRTELDACEVSR